MVHCIHINTWLKYTIVLQKTFLPVRGKQAKYARDLSLLLFFSLDMPFNINVFILNRKI